MCGLDSGLMGESSRDLSLLGNDCILMEEHGRNSGLVQLKLVSSERKGHFAFSTAITAQLQELFLQLKEKILQWRVS